MKRKLNMFNVMLFIIVIMLLISNYLSLFRHESYLKFLVDRINEVKNFGNVIISFIKINFYWIIGQEYDFSFNNRELALIILFSTFFLWAVSQKNIRESMLDLVKILFNKYFNRIYIEILIYTLFMIGILYNIGLWEFIYMKDTILWILFTALYLSYKVADDPKTRFINVLRNTINIMIVFQFLYNVYTFPLIVELIVNFILIVVGMLIAFTEVFPEKDKEGQVNKFMNGINTYIGISILIFLIREIIMNYNVLLQVNQLKKFLLPIVLTILFIPYLYYLVAWTTYDIIEFELKQNKKLNSLKKMYFRIRIRFHCKMNKDKIIGFRAEKKLIIRNMSTWSEIGKIFSKFP